MLSQALDNSYLDVLEFTGKRLPGDEAAECYSTTKALESYDANVLARYRFLRNLSDDKGAHALSAPSPQYI